MKILMVSMNSIHFRRWTEQLRDSEHEVFWFDILDQGHIPSMSWMHQITGWKKGFLKKRGRTFLKKNGRWLYNKLSEKYDVSVSSAFAKAVKETRPDVVHSFVMYQSCAPIFPVMVKFPKLKWIYSAWGNDLFYYQNIERYLNEMKEILPRIDYMFADCKRDKGIAEKHGFNGDFLGVFPGGGGFHLKQYAPFVLPVEERDIILIKGYEQRFGKCSIVIKAISKIMSELKDYKVIIFGADRTLMRYLAKNPLDPRIELKGQISHDQVLKLMGKSLIHIGNSSSDGMPNTLLEAIIMGALPIQSNPGGATAEVIKNGRNGLLIEDCEDIDQIKKLLKSALTDNDLIKRAFAYNKEIISLDLDYSEIKRKVVDAYNLINDDLIV